MTMQDVLSVIETLERTGYAPKFADDYDCQQFNPDNTEEASQCGIA